MDVRAIVRRPRALYGRLRGGKSSSPQVRAVALTSLLLVLALAGAPSAVATTDYPLTSVTQLPGGGQNYNYDLGEGQQVSIPVPPDGFNATAATSAQLEEYAMPPAPPQADLPDYGHWANLVQNWHVATPPAYLVPDPHVHNVSYNQNWDGDELKIHNCNPSCAPIYNEFLSNSTEYGEPHITQSSCDPTNQGESSWAGIGGDGYPSSLGQDGTEWYPGSGHDAWFEEVGYGGGTGGGRPNVILTFDISAGDAIQDYISWHPNEGSMGEFSGYVYDGTTGKTYPYSYPITISGDSQTGNSSESIVERETNPDGTWENLANFGNLDMFGWMTTRDHGTVYYSTFDGTPINNTPFRVRKEITNTGYPPAGDGGSATLMAETSLLSESHFTASWDACHG